ncbi:MAG: acyl-CoA thioesterase [Proteobacteria bacterium]|nr:acyl-CoA thioesterase [Pseudomonadota bacterium]MCP4917375.1 acyl-CoA thioesterase [Pseudomonadota bacterium]
MTFSYELPVRYADTDAQGHVFFANYLTYFDEGLTYYLQHLGCGYDVLEADGAALFYGESRCRYLASARFGDTLAVAVAVSRLGRTSMTTSFTLLRGEETLAEGELTSIWVDPTTRKPTPIPQRLRDALDA